jgi:hypothetical protein
MEFPFIILGKHNIAAGDSVTRVTKQGVDKNHIADVANVHPVFGFHAQRGSVFAACVIRRVHDPWQPDFLLKLNELLNFVLAQGFWGWKKNLD